MLLAGVRVTVKVRVLVVPSPSVTLGESMRRVGVPSSSVTVTATFPAASSA